MFSYKTAGRGWATSATAHLLYTIITARWPWPVRNSVKNAHQLTSMENITYDCTKRHYFWNINAPQYFIIYLFSIINYLGILSQFNVIVIFKELSTQKSRSDLTRGPSLHKRLGPTIGWPFWSLALFLRTELTLVYLLLLNVYTCFDLIGRDTNLINLNLYRECSFVVSLTMWH